MTTKINLRLGLLVCGVLALASCSKEKNPFEPFQGVWLVTSVHHRVTDQQEQPISDTTIHHPGSWSLHLDPNEQRDSRFNQLEFEKPMLQVEALRYLDSKNAVYESGGKFWVYWYTDYHYKRLFVWCIAPSTYYVQVYTIQEDKIEDTLTLYMVSEDLGNRLHEVIMLERQ